MEIEIIEDKNSVATHSGISITFCHFRKFHSFIHLTNFYQVSAMCQEVLDVRAIVEIKTKHSPYFHGAYYVVFALSSIFQGHLFHVCLTL